MKRIRINQRVDAAIARAARKFSPNVRVFRKNGDAMRVCAAVVAQNSTSRKGARLGVDAALVFAAREFERLVTWASDSKNVQAFGDLFSKVDVDGVLWIVDVDAAPVVKFDEFGYASVCVWREVASR